MKYVIWNKTQDKFWRDFDDGGGDWSGRYYASKYTLSELEQKNKSLPFTGSWMSTGKRESDLIFAVIAISV